jgi:hypothetical protein
LSLKTPFLQALKDVPIFNKYVKEEFIIRLWRRRKDVPTINVIGKLVYLMIGKSIVPNTWIQGVP